MSGVKLKNAIKRYGDVQVIHGIDLEIADGEFCVFVGPSGCGKSTLGRALLQLSKPSAGKVFFEGKEVTSLKRSQLMPYRQHMQIIFQIMEE